jgi:type I restriction enzyme M protein
VPDTFRLLLMNLHLHKIDPDNMVLGDSLSPKGSAPQFKNADLILSNPPFGPAGGPPTRDDLTITSRVSSFQLPFVEHIVRALRLGGRAAVVVPDNVLFDDGRGKELRQRIMSWCNLHTILRLPTGIFYAQGVKTNVRFSPAPTRKPRPRTRPRRSGSTTCAQARACLWQDQPPEARRLRRFCRRLRPRPAGQRPAHRLGRATSAASPARTSRRAATTSTSPGSRTPATTPRMVSTPEDIAAAIEGHLMAALPRRLGRWLAS